MLGLLASRDNGSNWLHPTPFDTSTALLIGGYANDRCAGWDSGLIYYGNVYQVNTGVSTNLRLFYSGFNSANPYGPNDSAWHTGLTNIQVNIPIDRVNNVSDTLALYAKLASPTFTGTLNAGPAVFAGKVQAESLTVSGATNLTGVVTSYASINTTDTVTATKVTCDSITVDSIGTQHLTATEIITDSLSADSIDVTAINLNGKALKGDGHLRFTIIDPDAVYQNDAEVCLWPSTDAAITITSYKVTLDADPTTEIEFSLKFADAFIGLASATVIDDSATVAGATSVTSGFGDATVPAGRCIYLLFDADPDDNVTQMSVDIVYDYD